MYVVITRKLRASMEPFWDLKLCVEYLTHVSSEYITSWVLLSLTSTAGRTSRILVADVIPWINKASLALYARTLSAMPRPTRWMALSSLSPVIGNYQYRGRESVSDSISAIEAPTSMWLGLCTHYIDDLLSYQNSDTETTACWVEIGSVS